MSEIKKGDFVYAKDPEKYGWLDGNVDHITERKKDGKKLASVSNYQYCVNHRDVPLDALTRTRPEGWREDDEDDT